MTPAVIDFNKRRALQQQTEYFQPSQPGSARLPRAPRLRLAQRAGPVVLALAVACSGCSSMFGNSRKDALAAVTYEFANDGVILEVSGEPNLNEFGGEPHTLLLGIYQMSDAAAFRNLVANPAALAKVLESGKAGDGFLQFSRYVVAPGQHSFVILDRAQKAQFVGVTAGYYRMSAGTSARMMDVPLITTARGMIMNTYTTRPGPLIVRMNFGADSILNAEAIAKGPDATQMQSAVPLDGGGKEIKLSAHECNFCVPASPPVPKIGN